MNDLHSQRLYKQFYVYGNNYYIHHDINNIGRMHGGKPLNDTTLSQIFYRFKNTSAKALKNQYKNYVLGSINGLSPGMYKTLEEALDSENSSDKILTRLHTILQQSFEAQFNNENLLNAMNKQASINWSLATNSQANELDKIFRTNNKDGNSLEGFKFLDEILQVLQQTCELLGTKQGTQLSIILANQRKSNYSTTRELGKNLNQALDNFIEKNREGSLTSQDIKEGIIAANLINNVAKTLAKNQTKSGKKEHKWLSVRGLQSLFQNNVFPGLSELFVNQVETAGIGEIYKTIGASIQSAKISATDRSYIQAYTPDGRIMENEYLKNIGVNEGKESKDFGKADSLLNVSLNAEKISGKAQGKINISVGISTKAYVSNTIGGSLDQNYESYSLGKGLNLGQAIALIPNFSTYYRYLGYNVISREEKRLPKSLVALQDVLLTRGMAYLAAGRGPKDSAQLLFLNGNIMSMWDVIQYAMYNNIGKSSWFLTKAGTNNSNNNGIFMHIAKRPEIIKDALSPGWRTRIVKTNNDINTAVIQLEIIPKKILGYINSKNLMS